MKSGPKKNDDLLIKRLKKDDKKALTELYNAYWKPLFISSYNLLQDKQVCEEIIQDIFIDLWNNREKLQIKISLKSYLYACTRYKVFAQFRKKKLTQSELFDDLNKRFHYSTPETQIMHQELVEQIESIVDTLPKRCKQVYKLSKEEQLSHKEIANLLKISTKTVENHITIALKTLQGSLGYLLSIEFIIIISQNIR